MFDLEGLESLQGIGSVVVNLLYEVVGLFFEYKFELSLHRWSAKKCNVFKMFRGFVCVHPMCDALTQLI